MDSTVEKQRLSDTYLTFLPKNTSGYTYQNQLIDVQIPKSEHIINLAKSYIHASIQIPLKISHDYAKPSSDFRFFVGFMNAANIFDQVQIHSNNKVIYTDTLAQVNSRIWQMSKPSKYLDANYHSFINIRDVTKNIGFIVQEITADSFTKKSKEIPAGDLSKAPFDLFNFNMRIPLPCLFNCFDNCEAFSTTQLNDNVTLMMQLSTLEKYLCLFETSANGKLKKVTPFKADNTIDVYDNIVIQCSSAETDKYQINYGFKIVTPGHYPTEEEKIEINNVIANGGWFRPFINSRIQAQDASFGPSTYGNTLQSAINFNTDVHNLYNIIMLASHEHTHTVFDKPKISDIELNASELWKLANGGTHTDATYDGDNDMYLDLLNGFGTQTFKNLERFDEAITHDYSIKTHDDNLYFEVKYRLTVNLKSATEFADDKSAIVETLSADIKNKHYTNVTDKVYSTEFLADKVVIIGRIIVKNFPRSSNDYGYQRITYTVNLAAKTAVLKGASTAGSTTINNTTLNITGKDGSVTTTKDYEFVLAVKFIKDKDVYSNFCSDQTYGSYLQFYKFAPSNQLGYSADYFSSQINYKFKNEYKVATGIEIADVTGDANMTTNNYDNSTLFCCCQTLYFLVFKEGGIDVINPFSEEIDVRYRMNNTNSYCGNGHGIGGFLPGLFSPVTSLIGKGINGLRNIIKENRSHANNTYAYSTLGKDGYEKHRDIISSNATMKKGKFKKFIDGLRQMEVSVKTHGVSDGDEEIAEFATFDDLNLRPFVQSYPAELADYEYKNQLILDYKNRFNIEKLRLASFGSEAALDANNYHGRVGDWFRRIGNKFRGWFKSDGKRIIKNIGSDLSNIANEYAAKIATGEISMSDIKNLKPQLKSQIMNIVSNSDKGTSIQGVTGDAIRYYKQYKNGQLKWNEIPSEMVSRIKEMDMKEKGGMNHGLIVRHGFSSGARIKPNILYSVQKQRINKLKSVNPMQLNRNKLRKLYRFNYLKNNGVVDTSHGRMGELLRQRYPNISTRIPYDLGKRVPLRDPTIKKLRDKWMNDKKELLSNDHGVAYLGKLRNKSKAYKLSGDSKYKYFHKKYKSWKNKSPSSNTPDYDSMKAAWKKYKSQNKK